MTTIALEGREVRLACEECGAHRVLDSAQYQAFLEQFERLTCSTCDTRSAISRGETAGGAAEVSGVRLLRAGIRAAEARA